MFIALIQDDRLRSAAKRHAARLPRQVHTDYGARETYTPAQIRKSAERAGLPAAYTALGDAAFRTEDASAALPPPAPARGQAAVRELLARFTPPRRSSAAPYWYECG